MRKMANSAHGKLIYHMTQPLLLPAVVAAVATDVAASATATRNTPAAQHEKKTASNNDKQMI